MQTRKEQLADLQKRLRSASKAQDPAARAAVQLVRLMADEAKESLVNAEGNDMLRLQGAARSLEKLFRELTVEPPGIQGVKNDPQN